MPSYDYVCKNEDCPEKGKVIEHLHSIHARKPKCESCGIEKVVYHGTPVPVHYNGKFFKNTGGY